LLPTKISINKNLEKHKERGNQLVYVFTLLRGFLIILIECSRKENMCCLRGQ
jgi:hypothetical protein